MKRIITTITLIAAVTLAACAQGGNTGGGEAAAPSLPEPTYPKVAVGDLPAELDFAGERVPLENFDTQESLRREMLVTLYMHSRTYLTLLASGRWFPIIEPILERNGIPLDFKYLCMAESGLDPEAVSSAKAGGLWQFMERTGTEYGLFRATGVDERFHVEKSTEAACKYIKDAYNRFGSWTLAAAAYNAGNAGVSTRQTKQGVSDYYDTYMPQETMRYVFRILSLKLIASDPQAYGYRISPQDYYRPLTNYTTVNVSDAKIEWSKVAAANGTNYKMLRLLNPWIRDYEFENKTGRTFVVKVPGPGFREGKTEK